MWSSVYLLLAGVGLGVSVNAWLHGERVTSVVLLFGATGVAAIAARGGPF